MKKKDPTKADPKTEDRREVERRLADRFSLPLQGIAIVTVGGEPTEIDMTLKNLGAFGAYFETGHEVSVSDRVSLRLPIEATGGAFETSGTVLRVDRISEDTFGVAIEFDIVPDFD